MFDLFSHKCVFFSCKCYNFNLSLFLRILAPSPDSMAATVALICHRTIQFALKNIAPFSAAKSTQQCNTDSFLFPSLKTSHHHGQAFSNVTLLSQKTTYPYFCILSLKLMLNIISCTVCVYVSGCVKIHGVILEIHGCQ